MAVAACRIHAQSEREHNPDAKVKPYQERAR